MTPSVYLETSVISYYAGRPSRDLVTTARQTITRDWWEEARGHFDTYISVLVLEEVKAGNPSAAEKRLEAIVGFPILEITGTAEDLAEKLVEEGHIPTDNVEDALHIALATVHGMDFLLTWNFRHINNAHMKSRIRTAVEAAGYECPVICSPEELEGETS